MITYPEMYEMLVKMRCVINGFLDRRFDSMYYYSEQTDWYGDKFHSWRYTQESHDCELFSYPVNGYLATPNDCAEFTDDGSGDTLIYNRTYVPHKYTKCGNIDFGDEEFTEEYFFQLSVLYEREAVILFCIGAYFKDFDNFALDMQFLDSLYEIQKYLKPSSKDVS